MKIVISDIKKEALAVLRGNWSKVAWCSLVYIVLDLVVKNTLSSIISGNEQEGSFFVSILFFPLTYGFIKYFLEFEDNQENEISTIFWAYKKLLAKSILLSIIIIVRVILWAILLIVPGVMAAISYSLAPFILVENPDIGFMEAISLSKKLTRGYKSDIFIFHLSFIGWYILGFITLGIGLIWVLPYHYTSQVKLYQMLLEKTDIGLIGNN